MQTAKTGPRFPKTINGIRMTSTKQLLGHFYRQLDLLWQMLNLCRPTPTNSTGKKPLWKSITGSTTTIALSPQSLISSVLNQYGRQTMDRIVPQKYELLLARKHLFFKMHYGARSAATYKTILMVVTVFKFLWWSLVEWVRPNKG